MIDDTEPEITEEAFSSKEREIADLFAEMIHPGDAVDEASEARIGRILALAASGPPGPDGEARIGRILRRIHECAESSKGE